MSAAVPIYIYPHTPSGQSRLYRVTQLRTDGVHCRECVVSKHNHCCSAAVHTVNSFFSPDLCLYKRRKFSVHGTVSYMLCFKTYRGTMSYCCTYYGPVFPPRLMPVNVQRISYTRYMSYFVFQNIVITTVLSFFPSRLLSVQETPCMSAAWKTILKQVC